MTKRIDQASRTIDAPASTVFAAFTSGDVMMSWLPPRGMTGEVFAFDFREGGGYTMRLTLDEPGRARGKTSEDADDVDVRFVTIVPASRIVQAVTFDSADPRFAGTMEMTWAFVSVGEGTEVTVTAEDVPSGISPEDHQAGLTSTLANLARFCEGKEKGK